MVDLARLDFGGERIKTVVLDQSEVFEDVTEHVV